MALVGLGTYLAYVPVGAVLFERMMAGSRLAGTSVFAIQLADGIGYTGSVLLQIYRDVMHGEAARLAFFLPYAKVVSLVGLVLIPVGSAVSLRRLRTAPVSADLDAAPGLASAGVHHLPVSVNAAQK